MENPATMQALTQRAFNHFQAKTTDQADQPMELPVAAYWDTERFQAERERIFKHLPIAVGLTLELPNPGDYKAADILETPVLLVRGEDQKVRAFLNVCRHRGAQICAPGQGNARVLACPYHAWVYGLDGALTGRYGETTFGDIDTDERGLIELACAERHGVIFAILTPGEDFDVDLWLGDFGGELATLELDSWHLYTQRDIPGPGWKVTMDGYLESYHHQFVHPTTVGIHTVGNLLVLDTYGPHQRLTFGRKSLDGADPTSWASGEHIRLIHSCFPNLSVSGILGDHCLVSQIYPGTSPDTTITTQTVLAAKAPVTDDEKAATQGFSDLTLKAVQEEDYVIGAGIQANIPAIAQTTFVIGRNEPGVQNYHKWVARFMQQQGTAY